MRSYLRRATAVLSVGALAVLFTVGGAAAQDKDKKEKKKYETSEIMKKGHGAKGLLKGLKEQIKGEKWDDAKTDAELLKAFGEALGENDPPKGDAKSWKALSKKYKENTEAVYKGVEKKDGKAATESLDKIGKSCMECHKAHKG